MDFNLNYFGILNWLGMDVFERENYFVRFGVEKLLRALTEIVGFLQLGYFSYHA